MSSTGPSCSGDGESLLHLSNGSVRLRLTGHGSDVVTGGEGGVAWASLASSARPGDSGSRGRYSRQGASRERDKARAYAGSRLRRKGRAPSEPLLDGLHLSGIPQHQSQLEDRWTTITRR